MTRRTRSHPQKTPRTRICTLGYSNQVLGGVNVATVESLLGRSFTGLRQNQAYTTTGWATAITEYDAGRTLTYRSIQFDAFPGGWAAVATGGADATMTTTFNGIQTANRWNAQNPALICLHHECTLSPFGTAGFLAADYKAMWQHLVPFADAGGWTVHRSDGTYNPNGVLDFALVGWDRMFVGANGVGPPTAGQGIDDVDPGKQYYRYLGTDLYNAIDSPGVLRYGTDAATLLNPFIAACVTRNKDFIIGEMGCEDAATTTDHTNKAAWLDSMRQILISRGAHQPGVCRALLTTIKASAENYNVDSSAESLAAFQRLSASTYFK